MASHSQDLNKTFRRAIKLANERHHEYATREHLLLALVDDPQANRMLIAHEVNIDGLRDALLTYIDDELSGLVSDACKDAQPTTGFLRLLQYGKHNSGYRRVTGAHVLLAFFAESERESHAAYFLMKQGLDRRAVEQEIVQIESEGMMRSQIGVRRFPRAKISLDRIGRKVAGLASAFWSR
jgi:ATP-dependent Clp protease ATP-binding subunit ClpA